MTAPSVPVPSGVVPSRSWQRVVRITRLQFVDPWVFVWLPAIITGAALLISIAIAFIVTRIAGVDPEALRVGMRNSWAVLAAFWYFITIAIQAMAATFPFALGVGSTRRDFWLGSMLAFGVFSAITALVFAGLRGLEIVTGGWGTSAAMFDALWYVGTPWWVGAWSTFSLALAFLVIGAATTACYMRWRALGVIIAVLAVVGLLVAAVAVITGLAAWGAVVAWFTRIGVFGIFAVVLGVTALAAIGGFLVIRRATPA